MVPAKNWLPLTRIDVDSMAYRSTVAAAVLEYLKIGMLSSGVIVCPKCVGGETF